MTTTPKILSRFDFGPTAADSVDTHYPLRFELAEFLTRFGNIEWHVSDRDDIDQLTGLPELIIQAENADDAIRAAWKRI